MRKSYFHQGSGKTFSYEKTPHNYMTIDVYDSNDEFYGTYDSINELRIELDAECKTDTD